MSMLSTRLRKAVAGIAVALGGLVVGSSIATAVAGGGGDAAVGGGSNAERRAVSDMTTAERHAVFNITVLPDGQTMGSFPEEDVYFTEDDLPDYIGVYNAAGYSNGEKEGWVRKPDYIGPRPSSPAEAGELTEQRQKQGPRVVPVYADDGKTVIGHFAFE